MVSSLYIESEHGSEEERRIWQLIGTFEGVRVEALWRLARVESDVVEKDPERLLSSLWNSSISLDSHGFVAIQRSSQLSSAPAFSDLAGVPILLGVRLIC